MGGLVGGPIAPGLSDFWGWALSTVQAASPSCMHLPLLREISLKNEFYSEAAAPRRPPEQSLSHSVGEVWTRGIFQCWRSPLYRAAAQNPLFLKEACKNQTLQKRQVREENKIKNYPQPPLGEVIISSLWITSQATDKTVNLVIDFTYIFSEIIFNVSSKANLPYNFCIFDNIYIYIFKTKWDKNAP